MVRKSKQTDDPVIGVCDVARQIGVHPSTVSRWCAEGLLKAIRLPFGTRGVRWGVRQSDVNRLLEPGKYDPVKAPDPAKV